MTFLVTGASGFVGRALCEQLHRQSRCFVACSRDLDQKLFPYRVIASPSLGCNADRSDTVAEIDVIIHTAARVHIMHEKSADPLAAFRQVNVQGTLQLATAAAQAGVKRFVFISTAKVNGESTLEGQPFTELDAVNPQDPYSVSKWEAEQGLARIAQQTGMEVVVIRPPLVYGPGVKANFASLMRAVQRGIPLPLGAIHNARSLAGLDNLVDFITLCISHPAAANQTFLVSDGQDVSTPQLVRTIAAAANVADRQIPVPVACLQLLGKIAGKSAAVERLCGNLQLDISKARAVLAWSPPVTLQEGIRRAMQAPFSSTPAAKV